jgi:signal transduction histidine kinase
MKSIFLIVPIIIILALNCNKGDEVVNFQGKNGVIDLRNWDFTKQPILNLNGEWEFYPELLEYDAVSRKSYISTPLLEESSNSPQFKNKNTLRKDSLLANQNNFLQDWEPSFISVPNAWNKHPNKDFIQEGEGVGTYRVRILLPKSRKNFLLQINDTSIAFRLSINGILMKENGKIGRSRDTMVASYKHPSILIESELGEDLILNIQISNFHHPTGGIRKSIQIGNIDFLYNSKNREVAIGWLIFGCTSMMGLYHLVLFLLRKKDISSLTFSLFCLDVSLRTFFTGSVFLYEILPDRYWAYIHKLDILTFVISLPLFTLFSATLFPLEVYPRVRSIFYIFGGIFSILVIFSQSNFYMKIVPYYQGLVLLGILFAIFVLVVAIRRKREGSLIFVFGSTILFIIAINDILNQMLILQTGYYANWGLLFFLFSQTTMLSVKFSNSFYKLEELQKSLESKVKERTSELEKSKINAEKANQLKDQFIALVSHDLRSPISSVIGILNLVRQDYKNMDDNSILDFLLRAEHSSRQSMEMIENLLDLDRLQSGSIELTLEKYVPFYEVDKVINKMWTQINEKQINIRNKLDENFSLEADKTLVNEIFVNLISNSVKFCKPNDSILIYSDLNSDSIEFIIEDTGVGIEESLLPNVFNKVVRTSTKGTMGETGTGLGLPLVYDIVLACKGKIRIDSTYNKGTKIAFSLPIMHKKEAQKPKEITS